MIANRGRERQRIRTFWASIVSDPVLTALVVADRYDFCLRVDKQSGLMDRLEIYNISSEPRHAIVEPVEVEHALLNPEFNDHFSHTHPAPISDHIQEIEDFARVCRSRHHFVWWGHSCPT